MLLKLPKTRLWSKSEYYQASDLGWFDHERVELIAGEIVQIAPQKDAHAAAVTKAMYTLIRVFGKRHVVRVQCPMNFGPRSQPEPDLVVTKGSPETVGSIPGVGF